MKLSATRDCKQTNGLVPKPSLLPSSSASLCFSFIPIFSPITRQCECALVLPPPRSASTLSTALLSLRSRASWRLSMLWTAPRGEVSHRLAVREREPVLRWWSWIVATSSSHTSSCTGKERLQDKHPEEGLLVKLAWLASNCSPRGLPQFTCPPRRRMCWGRQNSPVH